MKYLMPLFAVFLSTILQAQEYRTSHTTGNLIIERVANPHIKVHDGNEIIITVDIDRNSEAMERAKGLRAVNSLELVDNTEIGLAANKDGENFKITGMGTCDCNGEYKIQIPRSMGIEYTHSTHESEDVKIEGVSQEITISTLNSDVHLKDVTGPMSIKTVYGDIEATFESLNQESSVSLNSVYGLIDLSLPSNSKANVSLKTPHGQILTDMDIEVDKTRGMRELNSRRVSGTVNGGGVDLILKAGYENIYLRKK